MAFPFLVNHKFVRGVHLSYVVASTAAGTILQKTRTTRKQSADRKSTTASILGLISVGNALDHLSIERSGVHLTLARAVGKVGGAVLWDTVGHPAVHPFSMAQSGYSAITSLLYQACPTGTSVAS